MEQTKIEKSVPAITEESCALNRNRSFKSKQLVRSQAIRESQSPPRTATPSDNNVTTDTDNETKPITETVTGDNSSHASDSSVSCSENYNNECKKKQKVEIQITSGTWEQDGSEQKQRAAVWTGHRPPARNLLSHGPRVACVCGACAACPHCRGRRQKSRCPTKQDSGIMSSEDCPDCSDSEANNGSNETRKEPSEGVQPPHCRCPDKPKDKLRATLSKSDSEDKMEPSGEALVNFIKETLNKNARDRMSLLKIEKELISLIHDMGRCIVRFPVMTSYGRMLVHRTAALFQLSHHLDQTNKNSVLVSKCGTSGGRIPCTSFKQWCTASLSPFPRLQTDQHAKSILKRDTHSLDSPGSGSLAQTRSKSLEQREKDYEKVRRRIFSSDNCSQEEAPWPWVAGAPVKLLTPDSARNKLLKVQSLEGSVGQPQAQQWASRGAVSKSHSFGGYGGSVEAKRTLSRQGDLASSSWRLSPSSSGYRTLSLHSTDSVTPSPTDGASPSPPPARPVVCCVTDLAAVPRGALLLHPQTGRPLTNADGSVYHYDPNNPPALSDTSFTQDTKTDQNSGKRRGKLEKQHSFIDHECECQVTENCCNKCSCDCRRYKNEKPQTQQDQKPHTKQASPSKTRYEEPANHSTPQDTNNHKPTSHKTEITNQRPVYEAPTNQRAVIQESPNPRQESTNQRPVNVPTQEQEMHYVVQPYTQYRNDEVTSPHVAAHSYQPELSQQLMHKITPHAPVQMVDPNLRPVSLTNVMYPTQMPPPYPYVNRMEQTLQPVYPTAMIPTHDDKYIAPAQTTGEATFRIDPSYPYAPLDYTAQCGSCNNTCIEPGTMQQHQHRSYSVPYPQEIQPVVQPAYPIHNVMLQHHPAMHPYPYAEQVHWSGMQPVVNVGGPKLYTHMQEMYPLVYHNVYPGIGGIYPQMVPPAYPLLAPEPEQAAPAQSHRTPSICGSSRATPLQTPEDKRVSIPTPAAQQQNANLQQIKEQMAHLSTRDKDQSYKKRDDYRRRNSGNGLLGNYPAQNYNGRVFNRPVNDESQLSSAARAIVNSIRNMQAKNNYQDRRGEYHNRGDQNRPEFRRRDNERGGRQPHNYGLRQMSPGTWCRQSPGPIHPILNPRRPHPDNRNPRR